eukprot:m.73000 g.73000  ORF g.73000 m.73000 type:complete len:104 (-) comp18769_c0_seq2:518-829(-)
MHPPFKNPNYVKKAARKRSLKQILTTLANRGKKEVLPVGSFVSIKTGDSTRFKAKYSDVSGLKARYRDPKSGLLYASVAEFRQISQLTPIEIRDFLAFRGVTE